MVEYKALLSNIRENPATVGYYYLFSAYRQLEDLKNSGTINQSEYEYAKRQLDYNITWYFPLHKDAMYISSLSIWVRNEQCEYTGTSLLPPWLLRQVTQTWATDNSDPDTFPLFLFNIVNFYVKTEMKLNPLNCMDFSIRYSIGFDPRERYAMYKEGKITAEGNPVITVERKEEKGPEVKFIPEMPQDLNRRIEKIEEEQEKREDTEKKILDQLSEIKKTLTGQPTAAPKPTISAPEAISWGERVSPSERNVVLEFSEFHPIITSRLKKNEYFVSTDKRPDETEEQFRNWVDKIEEAIAKLKERRVATRGFNVYELQSAFGFNDFADSILRDMETECSVYRIGSDKEKNTIRNYFNFSLNSYYELVLSDPNNDVYGHGPEWDQMGKIIASFPTKEVCNIATDGGDSKSKRNGIGELIAEFYGTEGGMPPWVR